MLEARLRRHWDGLPNRERRERRAIAVEYPDGTQSPASRMVTE